MQYTVDFRPAPKKTAMLCKQCGDICVSCAERDCTKKGGVRPCESITWSCSCGRGYRAYNPMGDY